MAAHNREVPKSGSGLFFAGRLDSESRIESAGELRLSAHAIGDEAIRSGSPSSAQIAQLICPSGKSAVSRS
jgi:hypothetical protein